MRVSDRIAALRREMAREGVDIYLVPSTDYHQSEYVGDHFKERQFITGFTGSAGTAVITAEEAGLWTDGRYFIQAEKELQGSGIHLCKMGEPGVDTIEDYLRKSLPEGGIIGYDGRSIGVSDGKIYKKIAQDRHGNIRNNVDLIGRIWENRPELPDASAYALDEKYSGESTASKLSRVRAEMKKAGADIHLAASLDDIAWLLNIRGNDVAYCPLVLAYLLIYPDYAELFADRKKFSDAMQADFQKNRIRLRPYDEIYESVKNLPAGSTVLLDPERINDILYHNIPEGTKIKEAENPEILMKCIKNDVEVANIRKAHLKDAVAHTKFMYWIKTQIGKSKITEISASEKLESFRAEQDGYLGASFAPISAFAEHGAIVHYSASPETDSVLHEGKMLLTDTGGHYQEGSTDITRTVALGQITEKEKEDFTLTARAMLHLMNTVFLYGSSGVTLDCMAREVFWKERVNFNHGTGHGVGYLMNIHEPPISFRWKEGKKPAQVFEKNMIITDEPGIYIENSHGIRLENELLVCEDVKNGYGQFMRFEPLTFVPIDLDALIPERMSEEERQMLNVYHSQVYEKVSPHLTPDEREWLKTYTRPV